MGRAERAAAGHPRSRLRLMDEYGIEMMLLSLNAPAVQAIPDTARANEIPQGQRLSCGEIQNA